MEKRYECIISVLEAALGLKALLVCIQESFLQNRSFAHTKFNLYWPSETDDQKDMQVLTVIKKDILNKIIIDNWTNLVSHPYCIVLDIRKHNLAF